MSIKPALERAAFVMDHLADAVKQVAEGYRGFSESDMTDESLACLLQGANDYMQTLGDLLNRHDAVDADEDEVLAPIYDQVHKALEIHRLTDHS